MARVLSLEFLVMVNHRILQVVLLFNHRVV